LRPKLFVDLHKGGIGGFLGTKARSVDDEKKLALCQYRIELNYFSAVLADFGAVAGLAAAARTRSFRPSGEEYVIDGSRAALDDDAVSLQHEPRNQPVITKQACDHNKQAYEHDEDDR
jgi:hypothetical protein